ncbi:hypothetical protein INR49_008332, partial [Caranx melampygus]
PPTTTTTSLSSDMFQPVGHIPPLRLIFRLSIRSHHSNKLFSHTSSFTTNTTHPGTGSPERSLNL